MMRILVRVLVVVIAMGASLGLGGAFGLGGVFGLGGAAWAQEFEDFFEFDGFYPPPGASCANVQDPTPSPGDVVVVTGPGGCLDGGTFASVFFIQSEVLIARIVVEADGSYSTAEERPEIPLSARPGPAAIRVDGTRGGQPVSFTTAITITGAVADGDGGARLPRTGAAAGALAMWGFGFLGSGTALVTVARRRRDDDGFSPEDLSYPLAEYVDPNDIRLLSLEPDAYDTLRAVLANRTDPLAFAMQVWGALPALPSGRCIGADDAIVRAAAEERAAACHAGAWQPVPKLAEDDPLARLRAEVAAWTT